VKASSVTQDIDEEDEGNKPVADGDPEKPENKYREIISAAPLNPLIDIELQEKLKKEFTVEYEAQYEILAKKDLISDAEKVTIQIQIGNTYRHIDPSTAWMYNEGPGLYNKSYEHDWNCYIKMADPKLDKYMPFLISRVAFRLHQSRRTQYTDHQRKTT
jgi:hypothetical protein